MLGIIDVCLADTALDYRTFKASDPDGDGAISVFDIQKVITIILS